MKSFLRNNSWWALSNQAGRCKLRSIGIIDYYLSGFGASTKISIKSMHEGIRTCFLLMNNSLFFRELKAIDSQSLALNQPSSTTLCVTSQKSFSEGVILDYVEKVRNKNKTLERTNSMCVISSYCTVNVACFSIGHWCVLALVVGSFSTKTHKFPKLAVVMPFQFQKSS